MRYSPAGKKPNADRAMGSWGSTEQVDPVVLRFTADDVVAMAAD
jgi:hypothetical protein